MAKVCSGVIMCYFVRNLALTEILDQVLLCLLDGWMTGWKFGQNLRTELVLSDHKSCSLGVIHAWDIVDDHW